MWRGTSRRLLEGNGARSAYFPSTTAFSGGPPPHAARREDFRSATGHITPFSNLPAPPKPAIGFHRSELTQLRVRSSHRHLAVGGVSRRRPRLRGLRILSVQYLGHLPRAGHLVIDAVEIGLPHRMDRSEEHTS